MIKINDKNNNVIYKANNNCIVWPNEETITKTITRIKEHNIKLDQSKYSVILKHIHNGN